MVAPADKAWIKPLKIVVTGLKVVTHPGKWGRAVSVLVGKVKYRIGLLMSEPDIGEFKNSDKYGGRVKIDKRKIRHFTNPEAAKAHAENKMEPINIHPSQMRAHGLLGEGSFGKAEEVLPPAGVAGPIGVKKTSTQPKEEGIDTALLNEFEVLRGLDHPRIVKVNSARRATPQRGNNAIVMQHGGRPLDVMEAAKVDGKRVLNPFLFQKTAKQTLEALAYLKAEGICHRDIKPGNIVMDSGGDIKVIDFGVAKKLPEGQVFYDIWGTLSYLAPEMMQEPPTSDFRADVYALGCTIYKIITGKDFRSTVYGGMDGYYELKHTPFPQDKLDNLEQHMHVHAPDLPQEFINEIAPLLKGMMDPDPDKRPSPEEALGHGFFVKSYEQPR